MTMDNPSTVFPIWSDDAKNMPGDEQELVNYSPHKIRIIRNVTIPTLTVYQPEPGLANGTGVIVCPGGGFRILAIDHEGIDVARWLNKQGVTAFVLKYRLKKTPVDDEEFLKIIEAKPDKKDDTIDFLMSGLRLAMVDGRQSLKIVRQRADEWGIAPNRLGIMGFSAGGSIAAEMAHNEEPISRPDFVASIYGAPWENERVPEKAPPLFIALANDDHLGDLIIEAGMKLYNAWRKPGYSVELHAYAEGGHGFGMVKQGLPSDTWIERYDDWFRKL